MKLSYFELLSPEPVYLPNVGGIISPTLKDIASIGFHTYQHYLSILSMDLKAYFMMAGKENLFNELSDEEKSHISTFDLLIANGETVNLLRNILNFFIKEDVLYSDEHRSFLVKKNDSITGAITKDNFPTICNIICQRNYIKSEKSEDITNVKSKKAMEILQKLQKGRSDKAKQTKSDKNMELANIISAVANKSSSLNIINIWDLTIYQLWDCFWRLSNNSIYAIQSMSVAAWGNKDNHFDAASWFKRIETNN